MSRKINPNVKILTHAEAVKILLDKDISVDQILTKNSLDKLDGLRYNMLTGAIMLPNGTFPKGMPGRKKSEIEVAKPSEVAEEESEFMTIFKTWDVEDRMDVEKVARLRMATARTVEDLDRAMQVWGSYIAAKKKNTEIEQEPIEPIIGNIQLMKDLIAKQEELK